MLRTVSMKISFLFTLALSALALVGGSTLAQGGNSGGGAASPADPADAQRAAQWLEAAFGKDVKPEAVEMLIAIARGSQMSPGEGWFHGGQSRYDWKWLAGRHAAGVVGVIPRIVFQGTKEQFERLDRMRDGLLTEVDFDWSDRGPLSQINMMLSRLFYQVNEDGDGRLTREEWSKFFEGASEGKDHLTLDDLRAAMMKTRSNSRQPPSGPPQPLTPEILVRGLFRGEIGSIHEGPSLNQAAPDFSLKTRDGQETLRLSDHFGKKPIVLMFGNFTCGPFRGAYAQVDQIAQRYKDEALFLGIYVREAHPTDGWRMESNDEAGVEFAQPKSYEERVSVANVCHEKLKMSIPLLVDEIDDRVGHAYSGMPARLYVIDTEGKIAYKSGRGPFGFKPGEMEQALVLLLLSGGK
jgi:peroxiredoxin